VECISDSDVVDLRAGHAPIYITSIKSMNHFAPIAGGSDLALPPLSSAPGSGVIVPEGSQVPSSWVESSERPRAAAQGGDVDLERAREELPSVATRSESVGSGVSSGPRAFGGATTSRSSATTPRAGHTFPSSVESPSESLRVAGHND